MSREIHGLIKTSEYYIWANMLQRCYNSNRRDYRYYGGRGIKVCERWRNSFKAFLEDMGFKSSNNHTLDRVDHEGNYELSNCRWATRMQQSCNRKMMKNNTSGFIGVRYVSQICKWEARAFMHGKTFNFGCYADSSEAAYVRDQAMLQLHGADAPLNFELEAE